MEARVCNFCKREDTRYWINSEHGTALCYTCHERLGRTGSLLPPGAEIPEEEPPLRYRYGVFPMMGQLGYIDALFVVQKREPDGAYPHPYSERQPVNEYDNRAAAQWLASTLTTAQHKGDG